MSPSKRSYFLLTWRRPKRQIVDTINYYLQRIDQLFVEEIDELDSMARSLLQSAKEEAQAEVRRPAQVVEEEPFT